MHYVAMIDGQEHQVEIIEVSPERYQIVIDDRVMTVDGVALAENTLSLINDGEAYNVELEEREAQTGPMAMLVRGHILNVEVLDLRTMRLRKAQESVAGHDGPCEIVSPMPGKVVAVLVEEGAAVEEGQGVVVVEAMKMENELRAPKAGTVRKLTAEEGAAVESGVVLCEIE